MKANEAAKVLEQIVNGGYAEIESAGVTIGRTDEENGEFPTYHWTVNGNTATLDFSGANKRLRGYRADVIEKITYHSPEEVKEAQPQKISYVVDEAGLNKYGTPSEVLFAAGQKLDRGEITEEAFLAVSQGDITLDQAVAMADIGRAVESDMEEEKTESKIRTATVAREKAEEEKPKRAKANPARKGEKPKKKEKEKAEPKPKATWLIETLDDSGEPAAILYEQITSKDLLLETGDIKDTGKSRKTLANRHNAPVRMTHSDSGKFYVSKPDKK